MQYRPPSADIGSGCQPVSIVTGDNVCRHLSVVTLGQLCLPFNWCLSCVYVYVYVGYPITLLRYADKRIVNIMKVYIERN